MQIKLLDKKPDDWDALIKHYDTKTLFHESAWLQHVQSIHPKGKVLYYEIMHDGQRLGYFCAFQIYKSIVKIIGSPLGGTGTNYLGPIVNKDIDQEALVKAIRTDILNSSLSHLELSNEWFEDEIMEKQGFEVHRSVTHMIELPDTEEEAWALLKSSCRNRVRKAEKNGLIIEFTSDQVLAEQYYEQFIEVYAKQGMVTPFNVERPKSLVNCLGPVNRILGIRIKHQDEVVATGLFPYDENCIYFWGAASWLRHHKLCPNELLHWTVIKFAVENGIPRYNMCGGTSQFKSKFGGEDVPYIHYSLSSTSLLKRARNIYQKLHYTKLKVAGLFAPKVEKK